MTFEELVALCVLNLNINDDEVFEEMSRPECKLKVVRLEWVRAHLKTLPPNPTQYKANCSARGYLLYLLGCSIFVNKSSRLVPVKYLTLLEDLPNVHTYAWGVVALAYLYRQLGMTSRIATAQISGYLPLIETCWYEHFEIERSQLSEDYDRMTHPRATRWAFQ